MSASIALLISLKVFRRSAAAPGALAVNRHAAIVAVIWIEAVVYMAVEVGAAMKPRANADKGTAMKPFRAVVAIRSAAIGLVVIVTVGAGRFNSNADTNCALAWGAPTEMNNAAAVANARNIYLFMISPSNC